MADDPTIAWRLASPFGILIDEHAEIWHAGHCNDILISFGGGLVVAGDSGGVWSIVAGTNAALSHSDDWEKPAVLCLGFGPEGIDHIYAGGEVLYVSDPSAPLPRYTWKRVT